MVRWSLLDTDLAAVVLPATAEGAGGDGTGVSFSGTFPHIETRPAVAVQLEISQLSEGGSPSVDHVTITQSHSHHMTVLLSHSDHRAEQGLLTQ